MRAHRAEKPPAAEKLAARLAAAQRFSQRVRRAPRNQRTEQGIEQCEVRAGQRAINLEMCHQHLARLRRARANGEVRAILELLLARRRMLISIDRAAPRKQIGR